MAACRPVFPIRGPLGGAPLTFGPDCDRAKPRRHHGAAQPMVQHVLQLPAGAELGRLHHSIAVLLSACGSGHGASGLPTLSQPMATDSLAAWDDEDLPLALARESNALSHATARRRRGQSRPTHR